MRKGLFNRNTCQLGNHRAFHQSATTQRPEHFLLDELYQNRIQTAQPNYQILILLYNLQCLRQLPDFPFEANRTTSTISRQIFITYLRFQRILNRNVSRIKWFHSKVRTRYSKTIKLLDSKFGKGAFFQPVLTIKRNSLFFYSLKQMNTR